MTSYLRFEAPDGATILLEAEDDELGEHSGTQKAGLKENLRGGVAVAQETFDKAVSQALNVNARAFINAVRGLADPPDEVEISFGLKATGEVGNFVITKISGEMNYGVKLAWKAGLNATRSGTPS